LQTQINEFNVSKNALKNVENRVYEKKTQTFANAE